jgi:transcriptional antiterminator NusG
MQDNKVQAGQKQHVRADERNWYAIHTYSGYENAVIRNLKQRIQSIEGMSTKIFDVMVPMKKTIKIKGTKRVEVEEPIYPGYVLVDMIVDDESWYIIRNTPRVTGFVGAGNTPVPLTEKERDFLLANKDAKSVAHEIKLGVGDNVIVNDGPFKGFEGRVEAKDDIRGKVKVLVNMFGRDTSVELDPIQVKPL